MNFGSSGRPVESFNIAGDTPPQQSEETAAAPSVTLFAMPSLPETGGETSQHRAGCHHGLALPEALSTLYQGLLSRGRDSAADGEIEILPSLGC